MRWLSRAKWLLEMPLLGPLCGTMAVDLQRVADEYHLDIIYAFGSRALEALEVMRGVKSVLAPGGSDLDIGVKMARPLRVDQKADLAAALEDLFGAPRVDLVVLDEVGAFLAFRVVCGELLYARDASREANYQLFAMRRAADLYPFEQERRKSILGR